MNLIKSLPIHHNTSSSPPPPPSIDGHVHRHPLLSHVSFYWGREAQFLFPSWPDDNTAMYVLSLIFVFALAVLVEFLTSLELVKSGSNRVATVIFKTGFHAIRAGFGYLVVLAVMSYNGGVFIAAVLGHAVGFVAFGSGLRK